MNVIEPSAIIEDHSNLTKIIERAARKCYKSEDKIREGSDVLFVDKIKNVLKHESVLEHGIICVTVVNDRGISHEEVRHRHTAYSQESTRYCRYNKDKFGNNITFINPFFFDPFEDQKLIDLPQFEMFDQNSNQNLKIKTVIKDEQENLVSTQAMANKLDIWFLVHSMVEWGYMTLMNVFNTDPGEARSLLTNSTKTDLMISASPREWIHILKLRTALNAHPQMRQIMVPLGWEFAKKWPCLFGEFAKGKTEHSHPAEVTWAEELEGPTD